MLSLYSRLDREEMKDWIAPSSALYAADEADHILRDADKNKVSCLQLQTAIALACCGAKPEVSMANERMATEQWLNFLVCNAMVQWRAKATTN